MLPYAWHPYCGLPPDPSAIWRTWRLSPTVLIILLVVFLSLVHRIRQERNTGETTKTRLFLLSSGWIIATFALVSPLCPLSVSLFAARAAQHVMLTMVAAPLVAASLTGLWTAGPQPGGAVHAFANSPLTAAFVFGVVVWFWHAPSPYVLTFASVTAYWAMHITMFGSALWLWTQLVNRDASSIAVMVAGLVSTVQMGFLGALITLAPKPFYGPHFLTTDAWGLTPIQDQQLGGIIMWVLGCVIFLVASIEPLRKLLRPCGPGSFVLPRHIGSPVA